MSGKRNDTININFQRRFLTVSDDEESAPNIPPASASPASQTFEADAISQERPSECPSEVRAQDAGLQAAAKFLELAARPDKKASVGGKGRKKRLQHAHGEDDYGSEDESSLEGNLKSKNHKRKLDEVSSHSSVLCFTYRADLLPSCSRQLLLDGLQQQAAVSETFALARQDEAKARQEEAKASLLNAQAAMLTAETLKESKVLEAKASLLQAEAAKETQVAQAKQAEATVALMQQMVALMATFSKKD